MAEEIEFRGYRITANSYQDDMSGKWIPYADIMPIADTPNDPLPMSWEREFDTQLEADDYALESAELYISATF
jgi:hypothetical protein